MHILSNDTKSNHISNTNVDDNQLSSSGTSSSSRDPAEFKWWYLRKILFSNTNNAINTKHIMVLNT